MENNDDQYLSEALSKLRKTIIDLQNAVNEVKPLLEKMVITDSNPVGLIIDEKVHSVLKKENEAQKKFFECLEKIRRLKGK
jgi:hypothetical protein